MFPEEPSGIRRRTVPSVLYTAGRQGSLGLVGGSGVSRLFGPYISYLGTRQGPALGTSYTYTAMTAQYSPICVYLGNRFATEARWVVVVRVQYGKVYRYQVLCRRKPVGQLGQRRGGSGRCDPSEARHSKAQGLLVGVQEQGAGVAGCTICKSETGVLVHSFSQLIDYYRLGTNEIFSHSYVGEDKFMCAEQRSDVVPGVYRVLRVPPHLSSRAASPRVFRGTAKDSCSVIRGLPPPPAPSPLSPVLHSQPSLPDKRACPLRDDLRHVLPPID
ncbi:hypothetical protein F5Y14DRAFT_235097 [Nemania sp. NC0429]|nr:hypothetical protein F5Y14DRAFT_235097 [Nemania sp. NC0429]